MTHLCRIAVFLFIALTTYATAPRAAEAPFGEITIDLPEPDHFCVLDPAEDTTGVAEKIKSANEKNDVVLQIFLPCPQLEMLRTGELDYPRLHGVWRSEKPQDDGSLFRFETDDAAREFAAQLYNLEPTGPEVKHYLNHGTFYRVSASDGYVTVLAVTSVGGYIVSLTLTGEKQDADMAEGAETPGETQQAPDTATTLLQTARVFVTDLQVRNLDFERNGE